MTISVYAVREIVNIPGNILLRLCFKHHAFISIRNRHMIAQMLDTWHLNRNFTAQRSAQPFNHLHFRELFSNTITLITTDTHNR